MKPKIALLPRLNSHLRQFTHEILALVRPGDQQDNNNPRNLLFQQARLSCEDFGDVKLLVMRDEPIVAVMRKQAKAGHGVLDRILNTICQNTQTLVHIDVGTNYGLDLCHTAKKILSSHPNAHICGFDPGVVKNIVPHNLALNGLADKVMFYPMAIANKDGFLDLYFETYHSEDNRIVNPRKLHTRKTLAPCVTIDSYMKALQKQNATIFLKIDTQGAEPEVFEGASQTLIDHFCVAIAEFTPQSIATRYDPSAFLERLSGTHNMIDLGHTRELLTPISGDYKSFAIEVAARPERWTDILLLPKSAPELSGAIEKGLNV